MKKVIRRRTRRYLQISQLARWRRLSSSMNLHQVFSIRINTATLLINKELQCRYACCRDGEASGFHIFARYRIILEARHSSEHDFIFTTTQLITAEMLETIHDQLGENESLLICCTKFQPECRNKYSNITIKKNPQVLLDTCEFDHDDYSSTSCPFPKSSTQIL